MVNDHKQTSKLFEEASEHSTDADIKAFAAKNYQRSKYI